MEGPILLWIAAILGAISTVLRLIRAYGDELLDYAKWFRTFIDQMRAIWR